MDTVTLTPVALLGGTGMMLVALGFVIYAVRRRLGIGYLALGALAWIVTVAVKFLWALPLNPRLYAAITGALPGGIGAGVFDLYVGLLTGFTEVAIVWLVLRYTRLGRVAWERALAFGIGFGAVEAFLLGLSSFATMLTAMLAPQLIPSSTLSQLVAANNIVYSLAPIVERFFAVWVHIFANVLIFLAVIKGQVRWFWLAFWFKSLIDALAAFAQISGVITTLEGIWAVEAVVVVWGALAWRGVHWVRQRYDVSTPAESAKHATAGGLVTTGILVLVLVAMTAGAVFVAVAPSSQLTGSEKDAVLAYSESKTDNLLQGLNNNDYAVFARDLNDQMKAAIPETTLAKMRTQVSDKIGNYVSRQVQSISRSGDSVTVIYAARFANDDQVTLRVSFEAAEPHRISGLWFDSPQLRQP
jgi:uncharacterized membrane protein YhfC